MSNSNACAGAHTHPRLRHRVVVETEEQTMTKSFELGRAIFATAMAALGAQCLIRINAVPALEPVHGTAGLPVIGWITGVVLIAAAIATMLRPAASYGAAVLAAMLFLWDALLHAPALAAAPTNGGEWTGAAETFALGAAALVLFGMTRLSAAWRGTPHATVTRPLLIGRICYGISMLGFGALHFIYISYVAFVIPSWIPAHVFFAYATGVAHVAAGLGILSGVLARLAALCTAAMFGSWFLIIHIPRVVTHTQSADEWTSMLIALAMCGSALLIASSLPPAQAAAVPESIA
ncbi:MAG: DoxX family protein [Gemmatimonadaceae bacterium]